ncbi:MAG: efflux RND transporter periplasmic adaptor subunit [Burkholderiales bacterium]|nr:efflux RND transporter periplasmic adaptor subunit [Burkholderiales bacterium]
MTAPDLAKLQIDRLAPRTIRRGRRRWAWLAGLALALAAGAAAVGAWLGAPVEVQTVTVTTAYPTQAITALNATGYVVAQRKAAIASKATGRLEWLGVLEGSRVREGEVIARLENRDVTAARDQAAANVKVAEASLEQARAELADAERAFRRSQELLAKKFISDSAHDAAAARYEKAQAGVRGAEAAVAVARANLRSAEVALDQTLIRAPFDGVVLTRAANVGDNITPFSNALDTKGAVVTMADMATLEVEADVAESSLGKIRVGQPAEIQLDAVPGERFAGVVSRIVPTVDRSKATVLAKVRFASPDARVLPDMSAKVAFLERAPTPQERKPVAAVQKAAVRGEGASRYVYVVADGVAARRAVEVGPELGDLVEVRGVAPGERVVAGAPERALDGRKVKVAQK